VGYAPGVTQAKKEPITGLNWNPQAPYILATISQTGKVSVWDLRSKRVAVQFADRRITSARAISWNPNNPMQLITGSEDDSSPVIQVWNIRHTQMPTSTLQGHAQGIWSTSWCPHDTSYLLSTGKENRALCWNVDDGSLLHQVELRSEWNSEIQWSPQVPALFSVSSYQGQIGVYSLHDVQGKRDDLGALVSAPPAWLKRKAGASFGFGGRLVSVQQSLVTISSTVSSTPELEGYAEKLKSLLTIENYQDYCSSRASDSQSQQEREIWEFLQSQFEENPREYLLSRLGFSKEQLDEALERAVSSLEKLKLPQESESLPVSDKQAEQPDAVPQEPEIKREKDELASLFDSTPSGEDPFAGSNEADFFSFQSSHHDNLFDDLGSNLQDVHGAPSSSFADHHQNEPAYQSILDLAQNISKPIQLQGLADQESLLAQALILGNFSAAVNFCLGTGRLTDGLVIALASNDHSLVDRARDAYFQSLAPNSYLHIVDHVVRGQLRQLVAKTDVHEWKSTLGILCSYGSADEFAGLVSDLGSLLLHHQLEHPALLCFIIAGNVDKAIGVLERSLKVEDNSFASLQNIIEKVTIFKQANRNYTLSEALIQRYCACAEFLSAQGLLNYASDLISFLDQPAYDHAVKGKELLSRIRASLQEEQNLSGEYFRDTPASSGWDDVGFTQSGAQPVESVPQPHTNSDIGSVPSYHQAHPQYGIPASSPYPGNTLSSEPLAQTYNPHGSAFPGTQPVGGFTPANPFPAATPVVSQPVGGFTPANPFPAATPVVSQPVGGFTPANPFPGQSVNTFTPANPVGGFTPANPFPGQSVNTFTPANPFPAPTTQPIRQQVPDIPPVESLPSSVVGGSTPVGGPFGTPAAAPVPATPAAPAVRAPGIEIVERFTAIVNNYKVQYASVSIVHSFFFFQVVSNS
jgi:protein transport protein SEC31